jgi:hypothetical protein
MVARVLLGFYRETAGRSYQRMTKGPVTAIVLLLMSCSVPLVLSGCSPTSNKGCSRGGTDLLETETWNYIYARYFGPGTAGHCGNSRCHGERAPGGFLAGSTSDSFFLGLLAAGLVRYDCSLNSLLVDPQNSPLVWFSPTARMPADNQLPNAQAQADITAWLAGGNIVYGDGGTTD